MKYLMGDEDQMSDLQLVKAAQDHDDQALKQLIDRYMPMLYGMAMKLVGNATEQQVAKITAGAGARARLLSGHEVQGQVTFVSRRADSITKTFRVEITVPNDDDSLRDGSTVDISIALSGAMGHLLPQSALTLNGEGILGIRVVEDNKAKFIAIETIRDSAEGIWVSGLNTKTDVIVVGQEYVTDGRKVSVTFKEGS